MDVLQVERKRNQRGKRSEVEEDADSHEIKLVMRNGEAIVPSGSSSILNREGYGEWTGQEREGVHPQLRLSPEETLYLVEEGRVSFADKSGSHVSFLATLAFLDRFVVYRFLRRSGWIARSGLPYACDYLIYKNGPGETHASAGVIVRAIDSLEMECLVRTLTNVKKHLIMARVQWPSESRRMEDVEGAIVTTSTLSTAFLPSLPS